ncbi:MAG: RluA family pseudouridine synthase [Ignavibacteriales bacterium]|nr:RluA family pseudouridine synthase [Ignavibacteriales bacterium]
MRWKLENILKKNGGGILLEDETIIVLNKPAGLLVLPDRFDRKLMNLYDLLKETFGTIFVVHRIDRETSGVVLFAKTAEAHAFLNAAFEKRQVEKSYRAIVVGSPNADSGCIDFPISENEHGVRKMKIDKKNGKEAITDYKVLEKINGYALIEATPHTGRTHQIRIHLSAIGLPILADPLYSNSGRFFLSSIKRNYKSNGEEKPLLARTALHAFSLSFIHPATGEKTFIEVPMPKDMETVLKVLKKYQ